MRGFRGRNPPASLKHKTLENSLHWWNGFPGEKSSGLIEACESFHPVLEALDVSGGEILRPH